MFDSAAGLGKIFRSEVIPMLKSKGFNLKVATTRKSYYHDGKINVTINKVPTNFLYGKVNIVVGRELKKLTDLNKLLRIG